MPRRRGFSYGAPRKRGRRRDPITDEEDRIKLHDEDSFRENDDKDPNNSDNMEAK